MFIQNKRDEEFNLLKHNKTPGPKFVIQGINSVTSAYKETLEEQILK